MAGPEYKIRTTLDIKDLLRKIPQAEKIVSNMTRKVQASAGKDMVSAFTRSGEAAMKAGMQARTYHKTFGDVPQVATRSASAFKKYNEMLKYKTALERGGILTSKKATAKVNQFAEATRKSTLWARDFAQKSGAGMEARTASLAGVMRNAIRRVVIWSAAMGGLWKALQGFKDLIAITRDMETQMTILHRVMNEVTTDFEYMREAAFDLAQSYGVSIHNVMDAMVIFARQGLQQKEVLDMTEASILAANVSTLGLTEASEDLTAAVRQFNMQFSDSTEIVNKWNNVANKNATTMVVLADATKQAGIAGYNAGFNFDEFTGIVTALEAATRKAGSSIGRALKMIFQRMRRPSAIQQLQELDIQVMQTSTTYRRGADILADVAARWSQLTNVQKLNLTMAMAGTRRYNDLMVIIQNWDEVMKATRDSLLGFGSAEAENIKVMKTFQKQVDQLRASWQKLAEGIGRAGILQTLSKLVTTLNSVLKFFGNLPQVFKQGILVMGGLVAGLAALNVALKMFGFQGKLGAVIWAKFTGHLQKSKATLASTTVLTQQAAMATRNLDIADRRAAVGRTKFISAYQKSIAVLRRTTLAQAQAAAGRPLMWGVKGRPVPRGIAGNVPAQMAWFKGKTYLEQVAPTTKTIATMKRAFRLAGASAARSFKTGLSKVVAASRAVMVGLPRKLKPVFTKMGAALRGYGGLIGVFVADAIVNSIASRMEGRKKELAVRIGSIVSSAMMGFYFAGPKGAAVMGAIPAVMWLYDYISKLKDVKKIIAEQIKKQKEILYVIREQIEVIDDLRMQWEGVKKSGDAAALSIEKMDKMAHALATLKPRAFRGWEGGKALFRLPGGETLALEAKNLNQIMEELIGTTTDTTAAEAQLNLIFGLQAKRLRNLQLELLGLQKETLALGKAQDKIAEPTPSAWTGFGEFISKRFGFLAKAPFPISGLSPIYPLVKLLRKTFPTFEEALQRYKDTMKKYDEDMDEINKRIKQKQGEILTSYREFIDGIKRASAIAGRYAPYKFLKGFVFAQIIRPETWEMLKKNLPSRISDTLDAALAAVPGTKRSIIEKVVKNMIRPEMTIDEIRKIFPHVIDEIKKQMEALGGAVTAVTTEWLKSFDTLTKSLEKFVFDFSKAASIIEAQKEGLELETYPESYRGVSYYKNIRKLTQQLRKEMTMPYKFPVPEVSAKGVENLGEGIKVYQRILDNFGESKGVKNLRKTIDDIIKRGKVLEEVKLAPEIAAIKEPDVKRAAEIYATLIAIDKTNSQIRAKKLEIESINKENAKLEDLTTEQAQTQRDILTGAEEDLRVLLENRVKLLNKIQDYNLERQKTLNELLKKHKELFGIDKNIVGTILKEGFSLEKIRDTLKEIGISSSRYYEILESLLGLDKQRESKVVEEWKKHHDITETLSQELKSAIQLLDIYRKAGYEVDELSKRLANAVTSQRRLKEEAEYYLKPAREQAMISWLGAYMRGAPPEVIRTLGAQPRIAELIKGVPELSRLFKKGLDITAPETTRDVLEEIFTVFKKWSEKPLLTDDQATQQGTIIGEVAGKLMAGALATTTLKVKLGAGVNDYRFRSDVGARTTHYYFTIGDITIEGDMDPEEVRLKVKEGVKEGTIEAITGARGIIGREFEQNQLINIGE